MEILKFSLKRKEEEIIFEMESGTTKRCFLREMTGKQRDSYFTTMGDRMKFGPDGKVMGMKSYDGLQAGLLCLCLYDENGKPFSFEDVQNFPSTVQKKLYERAQKMNDMEEESKEVAKKD